MSAHATPSLRTVRPHEAGPLVRLGRDGDGGYLVPAAALAPAALLLSAGLHDDWSFEKDFKRHRPDARVVAVDGTAGLRLLLWRSFPRIFQILGAVLMRNFARAKAKWAYFKKVPDFAGFFRHEIFLRQMLHATPAPDGVTLPELMRAHAPAAGAAPNVLLKLDIEGAESSGRCWRRPPASWSSFTGSTSTGRSFSRSSRGWSRTSSSRMSTATITSRSSPAPTCPAPSRSPG
jgi:hypothetical protein